MEWIDDTSANIVFGDAATALQALEDFTLPQTNGLIDNCLSVEPRDARVLSTRPKSNLKIRTAFSTDQKRPRANEASRFYMMHPEHDPREKRRFGEGRQEQYTGSYRRRIYDIEEQRRRRRKDHKEGFDSMYDDNHISDGHHSTTRLCRDHSQYDQYDSRYHRDSKRPERNRSASPDAHRNSEAKTRHRTPPPNYRSRDPFPFPLENEGKELFPSKATGDRGVERSQNELFSNKIVAAGLKKELFPRKISSISHHRRSDAFDSADETADLFANALSVPFSGMEKSGSALTGRATKGSTAISYGRLRFLDPEPRATDHRSMHIRGATIQQETGFLICGGAAAGTIKELFPGKTIGNGGKELFAENLRGRGVGVRRNKAEDMFQ